MVNIRNGSVGRHSARLTHQSNPNPPSYRNKKRIENGKRTKHCHTIVPMKDLNSSVNSSPSRAIYGWLRTAVSSEMRNLHRMKRELVHKMEMNKEEEAHRNKDFKLSEEKKAADLQDKVNSSYERLARYQRALHKMEYMIVKDIVTDDEKDLMSEKQSLARKRVHPTFLNYGIMPVNGLFDMNNLDMYGPQNGEELIMEMLKDKSDYDELYRILSTRSRK